MVYLDGLPLKAPKIEKRIEKWGDEFGLKHWSWVEEYLKLQKEIHSDEDEDSDSDEEEKTQYTPSDKYLGSLTAGRPVFGHPSRKGAFRLRYGHSRTNGLAATSFHPATMEITQRFLAIGTQMKTEYPGKATVGTPCDDIHPPVVRLKDGEVRKVETREEAKEIEDDVEEILFLGDILVPFGEFVENGKKLLPSPYVSEWWEKELDKALEENEMKLGKDFTEKDPTPEEAFKISKAVDIPVHPRWTHHWTETNPEKFKALYKAVQEDYIERDSEAAEALQDILVQHKIEDGEVKINKNELKAVKTLLQPQKDEKKLLENIENESDIPGFIEKVSGFKVREQAPHYIGGRMGRPEKAERRTIKGKPQLLFPCGDKEGGRMRNLSASYTNKVNGQEGIVKQSILHNKCESCGEHSYFSYCQECGDQTVPIHFCTDCGKEFKEEPDTCESCGNERFKRYKYTDIDVKDLMDDAMENVGMEKPPELLKSVRGMSAKHKHVEPIEKGLLRKKHDLFVNKDGTVRYDASDIPMSHFKPKEIGVGVEKLQELGYTHDHNGDPLEDENQVCEMKPQDIVIPDGENTLAASDYFVRVANFIDDLLEELYGLEPYYDVEEKEDLIGSLIIGLAPHTSGGTVGRIIGFTEAKGIYAHPYWHAAKRRNCLPGDEEVKLNDGTKRSLTQIFEDADGAEKADNTGTIEKDIDLEVISEKDGEITSSRAVKVYRTPAQDHQIKFETASGREVTVFPDHRLKTSEGVKKARTIEEGDELLTPLNLEAESRDISTIKISEFVDLENVVLREDINALNEMIDLLGGLKQASDKLEMSKKTLSNYRYRESVPIDVLEQLSDITDKDYSISKEALLAAKRDAVELDNCVNINKSFLKLLGYYVAEGYTRKSVKKGEEFYQVCFAFGEKELKEEISQCIQQVFGLEASEGDHILTVSSRIIYELFQEIDAGNGAHDKKVPELVKSLPEDKIKYFLSAYFAGDGSVEKGRLHVQATSVSRELLEDIDLLLKKFGIFARYSTSEREAGGILVDKYEQRYDGRLFESHKLHIRSSFAVKFGKEIGFSLDRKQDVLENDYEIERKPRLEIQDDIVLDKIKSREIEKSEKRFMYDIEVEETHNFITAENLITNNCDGDEDAILLLMDGLLNFSRQFLPDMTGARTMDAPLILSTVLNPDEIDDEAWAIETVDEYPLQFYEETQDYTKPWELECDIQIGEDIVYSDEPFDHGFTHATSSVDDGPNQSEYVTLDEMSEKVSSQLEIGEKLMAVNENEVAELLLNKHFLPDIKGNLRSFSSQKMRCVSCNTKFRRVPMTSQTIAASGKTTAKCPECGGKVLLTISEGTIKKYLIPSEELIDNYQISPYTRQQVMILKNTIQSLFGKDQRQSGLSQFT